MYIRVTSDHTSETPNPDCLEGKLVGSSTIERYSGNGMRASWDLVSKHGERRTRNSHIADTPSDCTLFARC